MSCLTNKRNMLYALRHALFSILRETLPSSEPRNNALIRTMGRAPRDIRADHSLQSSLDLRMRT